MITKSKFKLLGVLLGTLLVLGAAQAHALRFSFENITNSIASDAAAGESQLYMVIDPVDDTEQVLFTFGVDDNTDPYADMFIEGIYFDDDGTLFSFDYFNESPGVQFTGNEEETVSPGDLPGGQALDPPFIATRKFSADADAPSPQNGINPGETLGMAFSLQDSLDYDGLIRSLSLGGNDGGLRVGLKVQGFESGGSEGFVNNSNPVPEPASMLLLGSGLMGLAVIGRRKLKKF